MAVRGRQKKEKTHHRTESTADTPNCKMRVFQSASIENIDGGAQEAMLRGILDLRLGE